MKKWLVLGAVAAFAVLATGITANAEMGVGVMWEGNGITPDMVLPIKLQSGLIISPIVGFSRHDLAGGAGLGTYGEYPVIFDYVYWEPDGDPAFTQFRIGVSVEKELMPGGTTALIGARGMLHMNSPSDLFVWVEDDQGEGDYQELDSWMNIEFTVYLGGSASLTDDVDIVGAWGPTISMLGAVDAGDQEFIPSATNFGSSAHIMLRWWLWGK
jgi:hypothetical protein